MTNTNKAGATATAKTSPLFILYGSATGNAETIACDLAAAYQKQLDADDPTTKNECFFSSVTCLELDQFKKKKCLSIWEQAPPSSSSQQIKHGLILICSTTGNGDAPENASRFVRFIKRKTTPTTTFQHTAYAVLGLGDTNYDQFCQASRVIDKRMAELGGCRVKALATADEAVGLEEVVEPWTATVLNDLIQTCRGDGGGDDDDNDECDGQMDRKSAEATTVAKEETATNVMTSTTTTTTPSTTTTTTTSSPPKQHNVLSSQGVQTLRGLLQQQLDDGYASSDVADLLPSVHPTDLPTVSASRSSCELIHDNDNSNNKGDPLQQQQQQEEIEAAAPSSTKPRSGSISTVSSSGLHYTHTRPFVSAISKARYLTRTPTAAAAAVAEVAAAAATVSDIDTTATTMTDESMMCAQTILEEQFPLYAKVDNNNNNSKNSTAQAADDYERNAKRVIEMTLSLPEDDYATLEYAPGDSLGLIVPNAVQDVQFVLKMFQTHHNIQPHSKISIDEDHPITVEEAVREQFDLSSPLTTTRNNNTRRLLHSLSLVATDPEEQRALQWLAASRQQGEDLARIYIEEQRRTVVDLLREFPSTNSISVPGLLSMLPSIPPRYYSVSSSPLASGDGGAATASSTTAKGLTVAFSVVDYMTPSLMVNGQECGLRRIHGVATNYLEILCSPLLSTNSGAAASSAVAVATTTVSPSSLIQPSKVKIFPKPTVEFRMPNTLQTPLVLIGPGTGVAPFMGFLAHRRALMSARQLTAQTVVEGTWRGGYDLSEQELSVHHGKDSAGLNVGVDFRMQQGVGTVDLFFGCRHADHDWLYREEMQLLVQQGVLSELHTAFSRDNGTNTDGSSKKVYVQDLMRQSADRLCDLILSQKANVFVCGDGNAMAKDVQAAVVDILSEALGGTEQAQLYLETMKKDKRFLLDIWS